MKGGAAGVYLTTIGTRKDLERQGLELRDGLVHTLWDEDIEREAVVRYDRERHAWRADFVVP